MAFKNLNFLKKISRRYYNDKIDMANTIYTIYWHLLK